MRLFSRFNNHLRHAASSKLIVMSAFALLLGAVVGTGLATSRSSVQAANGDCSTNSIIKCGSDDANAFAAGYKANQYGDLPAIYANYGLSSNEVERFRTTAKAGTAYKDGRIVVDGKTVATNAASLGRVQKSGDKAVTINGKTYYEGPNQTTFRGNSAPVLVMMDANGQFEFAIINACANPIRATPVKVEAPKEQPKEKPAPTYTCQSLAAKKISRTEYQFTVTSAGSNGATVKSYGFNFGDGTTETYESTSSTFTTPTYTYETPGTYAIAVGANFDVNGQTRQATSEDCKTTVTITEVNKTSVCRNNEIVTIAETEKRDTDLPVDSEECQPEEETPPAAPVAETPPTIPSTGPAEMIGAAAGISSLTGASYYWIRSRRDLISSILNK